MLPEGLYEQLINKLVLSRLENLDNERFYIKKTPVEKEEAANLLSHYLISVIRAALGLIIGENSIEKQIELSNKIINVLQFELKEQEFSDDLIDAEGKLLSAIFSKVDARFSNFNQYLKEITPYTGLSQSELFTGNNAGISLESELKKEILSSDRICFLLSFIKWTGIRIFEKELFQFTNRGGKLQVITTSYMGATDLKAVEYLSSLANTEVTISYNVTNERLHAKAYLLYRNTGFHTSYVGSSNISRTAL